MYFSWLIVDITCNYEVKNVFQHRNDCLQIERLILIYNQVLIDCMQQKIIYNWMEFGHNLYNLVFSFFCWGRLFFRFFFFFLIFILFFNFTILYWFCHISKWIRHRYTCVPHPKPSSLPNLVFSVSWLVLLFIPLFQPEHLNIKLDQDKLFSLLILNYYKCRSPASSS